MISTRLGAMSDVIVTDLDTSIRPRKASESLARRYAGVELGRDVSQHLSLAVRYTRVPNVDKHRELGGEEVKVIYLGASETALTLEYRF